MEKKEFKAESKRLLDLMINSIYTHKEIFIREIISNASDATDKRYYNALQRGESGLNRDDLEIRVQVDIDNRAIIVSDKGCGMTMEELEENLGTIAKSGSLGFKQALEKNDEIDIIGQFGVGFYSAFMVSDRIEVITKSDKGGQAYKWESAGIDGYTIVPWEKEEIGTDVIMYIKQTDPDAEDGEDYDRYLREFELTDLIRKYSDYIHYPINYYLFKTRIKEGTENEERPQYEGYREWTTLNKVVPLWKKPKNEITPEEYNMFYFQRFGSMTPPMKVIHANTEGAATYTAMLFVPSQPDNDYYTAEFEKGLQLYSNGVLIMEKCADLLPDYFKFMKGVVDSQDLSLNISREMLQHDKQLKVIAGNLEKKIKSELLKMQKDEREKYEMLFGYFGEQMKLGIYNSRGEKSEFLQDLLIFYSDKEKKSVTLAEYVENMPEEQKYIYYVSGTTVQNIEQLPQMEKLRDKGYDVLYCIGRFDEFSMKMLQKYKDVELKSINDQELGLESEEEKQEMEAKEKASQDMFKFMCDSLNGEVEFVKLSNHLKTHPVCITTHGNVTLEMERMMRAMPGGGRQLKAEKILEINGDHPIYNKLVELYAEDLEKLKTYSKILYGQAMLQEGIALDDTAEFVNAVTELMLK